MTSWHSFLLIPPKVLKEPSMQQITKAYGILATSDAPILASAIAAKPSALVTWNTKHFMRKSVVDVVNFPILTPGDFLRKFLAEEQKKSAGAVS